MSKERELLKKILMLYKEDKFCILWEAVNEIEELLAQPEQEPVAWFYDYDGTTWVKLKEPDLPNMHHSVKNIRPLYTTPPKREPLSDDEMRAIWKEGIRGEIPFVEIGRAIEKAHGIGVDDE
jgi:hypothetical protein